MDASTCAAPHPKPRNGTRCRHKRPVLAIVETVSGHRKRKLKKTGAEIIRGPTSAPAAQNMADRSPTKTETDSRAARLEAQRGQ
jgi:hypothetical protein